METIKLIIRHKFKRILGKLIPELRFIKTDLKNMVWNEMTNKELECEISGKSFLYPPYHLDLVRLDDYSYIAGNSWIPRTVIGKFCSIGMYFICGRGIHPTNGISTSPYFYSTEKQNGASISKNNKIEERKWISIGNDCSSV